MTMRDFLHKAGIKLAKMYKNGEINEADYYDLLDDLNDLINKLEGILEDAYAD